MKIRSQFCIFLILGVNFINSEKEISKSINLKNTLQNEPNDLVSISGEYKKEIFSLKWLDLGDKTRFSLTANIPDSEGFWMAFSFSKDQRMGDDNVFVCRKFNNDFKIENSYVKPNQYRPYPLLSDNPSVGLENTKISYSNGVFKCLFTRIKSLPNLENHFKIDSASNFYILNAYGSINSSNIIVKHGIERYSSDIKYNFVETLISTTPASEISPGPNLGLFNYGPFELKWFNTELFTEFIFKTSINDLGDRWSAFAFSNDKNMGDDDVSLCFKTNNNKFGIEHYFNNDKSPEILDKNSATVGFSEMNVNYDNSVLTCKFKREKSKPDIKNYFDLKSNSFYLFVATGPLNAEGKPIQHSIRISSENKIDFNVASTNSAVDKKILIKFHGIFMLIAWTFISILGVFFARYFKFLLPKEKLCGVQIWFAFHRSLMMAVPIFSLIAFLLVLSYKNWSWTSKAQKTAFTHSIFGILTICFAFIQPFLAFFRPDKDHKNRPIFNWSHRILGVITILFSIIASFLGFSIYFPDTNAPIIVLGVLTFFIVLMIFLQEKLDASIGSLKKNQVTGEPLKMNQTSDDNKIQLNYKKRENLKFHLLLAYLVISVGFTIALISLISIQ